MKPGELYIVAGLRTADAFEIVTPAYTVVSKELPGRSPREILRELASPRTLETLSGELGCGEDEIFRVLSDRVSLEVAPPPAARFTVAELKQISSPEAQDLLADALGCRSSEVIDRVFDREKVMFLLRAGAIEFSSASDTQALYYRLAAHTTEVEVELGFGPQDWGSELDRLDWLNPAAEERLLAEARENGWDHLAPSEIVCAVMVGNIERSLTERRRFDSLAVTELKRRASQVAENLRDEAAMLAQAAAEYAPPRMVTVARLPGWLDVYERGAIVSGLKSLLTGKTMLVGEFALPRAWKTIVVDAEPAPGAAFTVQAVKYHRRLGKKVVTFEVAVRLEGGDEPRAIAKATAVPRTAYENVAFAVKTLRATDLAPDGDQLGERLLGTRVPSPTQGLSGLLRVAVERHAAVFAQALLLCGETAPIGSDVAWKEHLATKLRFVARDPNVDLRFPDDAGKIAARLHEEYAAKGAPLVDLPPLA